MHQDCLKKSLQFNGINPCLGISPALTGLNINNEKVSGLMELFKSLI